MWRSVACIGLAATVLTLPFWQERLLQQLQLHTPDGRRVAELMLTADRLAHQVDDLQASLRQAIEMSATARAEAAVADRAARAAQARLSMVALLQLGAAVRHTGRFETELAAVRAAGSPPDGFASLLERIRPYAGFGIPASSQLHRAFSDAATRLDGGGSLRLIWLAGLVGLADPPPVADEATMQLLARVRRLLAEDNLAAAVDAARQAANPAGAALADWAEDGAARVAADRLASQVAAAASRGASTEAAQARGETP